MDIQNFITLVGTHGLSRNNKFEVFFPKRAGATKFSNTSDEGIIRDEEIIRYYAESVSLPGKFVNTTPTKIQGIPYELPVEFGYSDFLKIRFKIDVRYQTMNYFNNWLQAVCSNGSGTSFSPRVPQTYTETVIVNVIDYIYDGSAARKKSTTTNPITGAIEYFGNVASDAITGAISGIIDTATGGGLPELRSYEARVAKYKFFKTYPKSISGLDVSQSGRDFQYFDVIFAFEHFDVEYPFMSTERVEYDQIDHSSVGEITNGIKTGIGAAGTKVEGAIGGVVNKGNVILNKFK